MKFSFEYKNIEFDTENGEDIPLALVEEIIEYGTMKDWLKLINYMTKNPSVLDDVLVITEKRLKSDTKDKYFYFFNMIAKQEKESEWLLDFPYKIQKKHIKSEKDTN